MTDVIDSLQTQIKAVLDAYVTTQGQGLDTYEVKVNKFDKSILDIGDEQGLPLKFVYLQLRDMPFFVFENGKDILLTYNLQIHIILDSDTIGKIGTLNEVKSVVSEILSNNYNFNGSSIDMYAVNGIYPTPDTANNKFYFDVNIKYL